MKLTLTYTIPNLSVPDAADLEAFLDGRGFDFEARPAEECTTATEFTGEPPAPTRRRLSQAEVAGIYARCEMDRKAGTMHTWEQYAAEFGVSDSTVARIASGNHPLVTEAVKAAAGVERREAAEPPSRVEGRGSSVEAEAGSGGFIVAELC